MFDIFPILLKEGWPEHFFIKIQMLIPAGVVDFCGFQLSSITSFSEGQKESAMRLSIECYLLNFLS